MKKLLMLAAFAVAGLSVVSADAFFGRSSRCCYGYYAYDACCPTVVVDPCPTVVADPCCPAVVDTVCPTC